jgi:hypothetical protein
MNTFEADQPYFPGSQGYVGGSQTVPGFVPNNAPWTSLDYDLYTWMRKGATAYRFDLPNGEYIVRLYLLDGKRHGPNLRLMDIWIEGVQIFDDLDLCAKVGFMGAYEYSIASTVSDGTLDVEFDSPRGGAVIGAIGVWDIADPGIAPDSPTDFTAMAGYEMNILRWGYEWDVSLKETAIYRRMNDQDPWLEVGSMSSVRRYFVDWDAFPGMSYEYAISHRDAWGRESALSVPQAVNTMARSETGLPWFEVNITTVDYDSLNANPFSDDYYNIGWAVDGGGYHAGEARFRGGLAKFFNKKSWKVRPGLEDAYADFDELLFISNPDDNYLIRNKLSFRIFDELNVWHSDAYSVSLFLNSEYRGVYDLVEPVDEDFVLKRGDLEVGNLYKAYADMGALANDSQYHLYYEYKGGSDQSYDDLRDLIEGTANLDDFDFPPFIAERIDFGNFFEYYSMMIYTRQYDFIDRNYYLYHSRETGRWSFFPWDMTLSFWPEALALDFGTENSPHFWDGAWNCLFNRMLEVPQIRWAYAKELENLHATVLNGPNLENLVNETYDPLEQAGDRDVYRAFFGNMDYYDIAESYLRYRLNQRDTQFETMIPDFKSTITPVGINELQLAISGPGEGWVEIHNYGEESMMLVGWNLYGGDFSSIPATVLEPGDYMVHEVMPTGGPAVLDPAGGILILLDQDGNQVDRVRYGPLQEGASEGRFPDGWITWQKMLPSSGLANQAASFPRILSADFSPENPWTEDSLRVDARLGIHERPYTMDLHLEMAGQSHELEMMPTGPDSLNWFVESVPMEEAGMLKWWIVAVDSLGMEATYPIGAPFFAEEVMIQDASVPLFLNEFMADNVSVLPDEAGSYDDWIEIYNAGSDVIDLAGMTLSDDLAIPGKWTFPQDPASVIEPFGYLIVWADNDPQDGPLHANFKLSSNGEEIGFYQADGTPIDFLTFGSQLTDISYGRYSDGGLPWDFMETATPGASNSEGSPATPVDAFPLVLNAWPNPFNPRVQLQISLDHDGPASLHIYDVKGRQLRSLFDGFQRAGLREVIWDGRDERGRSLVSGIYFARLQCGDRDRSEKLLLLK